eukprot:Pompholyxophrys_punicea_v1_NODE_606_length_1603_cov_4.664083.p1 type:complete len:205 gc:universal NODE_606_length_1603_cov_4.664083:920-306(-)
MFSLMKPIFEYFALHGVAVDWGSSDGFSSHYTYLEKLRQAGFTNYHHIFDPVHIIKNLRNVLLNKVVFTPDCLEGFSLKTLGDLRNSTNDAIRSKCRELFPHDHDIFPDDKMDVDNVLHLCSPPVTTFLQNLDSNSAKQFRGSIWKKFYIWNESWNNNTRSIGEKIPMLEQVKEYFDRIQTFNAQRQADEESFGKNRTEFIWTA